MLTKQFLRIRLVFAFTSFIWSLSSSATNRLPLQEPGHSKPKVFFLFTQKEWVPDFILKLSSIPVAAATNTKYGTSMFSALPITMQNVMEAFENAEAIIIGTHGLDGEFITDDDVQIGPKKIGYYPNIKLIYFGSCYFVGSI